MLITPAATALLTKRLASMGIAGAIGAISGIAGLYLLLRRGLGRGDCPGLYGDFPVGSCRRAAVSRWDGCRAESGLPAVVVYRQGPSEPGAS